MGLLPLAHPLKTFKGLNAAMGVILADPKARRDVPRWMVSCAKRLRRKELGVEMRPVPCFTFGALDWLDATIAPDWTVFEWGSGASTLYFAQRVSRIISIEHHEEWAALVNSRLANFDCDAQVRCRPPVETSDPGRAISARTGFENMSFAPYADAVVEEKTLYDLIIVDGRARVECARQAKGCVRPGGYIILDNAERPRYSEIFDLLSDYPVVRYKGLGPYSVAPWETAVWQNPTESA